MTVIVNAENPNGSLAEGETLTETDGGPAVLFEIELAPGGPGEPPPEPPPMSYDNMGTITVTDSTPSFPSLSYGISNGNSVGAKPTSVFNHGTITVSGRSSGGIYNVDGEAVDNSGTITVTGTSGAFGIFSGATLENHGSISVSSTGSSIGLGAFHSSGMAHVVNDGVIDVVAANGGDIAFVSAWAYGVNAGHAIHFVNAEGGSISAEATTHGAVSYGVYMRGGALLNDGEITATGVSTGLTHSDAAYGVYFANFGAGGDYDGDGPEPTAAFGTIVNNGTITASTPDLFAVGIMYSGGDVTVAGPNIINHGTIDCVLTAISWDYNLAPVAFSQEWIVNDGVIRGLVYVSGGDDIIVNTGTMTGDVNLGEGNDSFETRDGVFGGFVGAGVVSAGAGDDFVRTDEGQQELLGDAGADNLAAGADDDYVDGGEGADKLRGQSGNDIYVVDNVGDKVFEDAGGGTDLLTSWISWTLGANLENIRLLGDTNINATGNALDNSIAGNAGANILRGGAGVDTFYGGAGDDIYYVESTAEHTIEETSGDGIEFGSGIDTVRASISWTLAANIENLQLLGSDAVNGTGNEGANRLTGNSAANVLKGGLGDDVLVGGAGADTMYGSLGDDTYYVDNAGDRALDGINLGTDTVSSTISWTLTTNLENLTLTGSAAIDGRGNAADNVITGNNAANALYGNDGNDTLKGGLGDDVLRGGLGNDTLNGGGGADAFVFNTAPGAGNVDTVQNFSVADDTIWIDNNVFLGIGGAGALPAGQFVVGAAAADASDHIIYNATTGALYYDADGNGAGSAVQFAQLASGLALTSADFLVI